MRYPFLPQIWIYGLVLVEIAFFPVNNAESPLSAPLLPCIRDWLGSDMAAQKVGGKWHTMTFARSLAAGGKHGALQWARGCLLLCLGTKGHETCMGCFIDWLQVLLIMISHHRLPNIQGWAKQRKLSWVQEPVMYHKGHLSKLKSSPPHYWLHRRLRIDIGFWDYPACEHTKLGDIRGNFRFREPSTSIATQTAEGDILDFWLDCDLEFLHFSSQVTTWVVKCT